MPTKREATVDDLYRVDVKKAELVNGELVVMSPGGGLHGYAAGRIYASLAAYEDETKRGHALPDSVGFIVNLPNRRSFSPDAAFCTQSLTNKFVDGAPRFAAEVRNEEDDGPDVDILREYLVRVFRASDPETAVVYRRGERAAAEPALPAWSMPVDHLFPR